LCGFAGVFGWFGLEEVTYNYVACLGYGLLTDGGEKVLWLCGVGHFSLTPAVGPGLRKVDALCMQV